MPKSDSESDPHGVGRPCLPRHFEVAGGVTERTYPREAVMFSKNRPRLCGLARCVAAVLRRWIGQRSMVRIPESEKTGVGRDCDCPDSLPSEGLGLGEEDTHFVAATPIVSIH
jgi:hypothetical protein